MSSTRDSLKGSVSVSDFVLMAAGLGLQQAVVARSINISLQTVLLILVGVAMVGTVLAIHNVQKVWDLADLSFRAVGGVVSVASGYWGSLAFAVLWENPNWVGGAFFVAVMLPTFGMVVSKNWALSHWKSALAQLREFHRSFPYII